MYLSFATVYMLAGLGDAEAIHVRRKLASTPGLIPYVRNGRMGAHDLPRAPATFPTQLVGATALCGYVLGTTASALLALA